MDEFVVNITTITAATLITVPLLGLYIVYLIAVKITHRKLFAVKLAADCTTLLFMTAVYFIVLELWDFNSFWLLTLFFLFTAAAFTLLHWYLYEDIHIRKVLKGVWRFQFFVYFLLYFILIFYGMITNIMVLAAG
ncbi:Protein of unknown function [Evansella caseinilytica]|uniref:DUF3397 domain-containing protein n=1 Tax=Evansella caseinilytica TaxID=1503961 RepID=A0A1H3MI95_9BACI|nr:DUF3397 domain-containing protein [Evansella caseinilytica]SDY76427.1 Protein of unknown function [Evansella caseinilytica]